MGYFGTPISKANCALDARLYEILNDLSILATELATDMSAHTHSEAGSGANNSGVGATISATYPEQVPAPTAGANLFSTKITPGNVACKPRLYEILEQFRDVLSELKTDMSAHVHGGCTTSTDPSGAGPTITAVAPAVKADLGGLPELADLRDLSYGKFPRLTPGAANLPQEVWKIVSQLRTLAEELRADLTAHTHATVTAGAGVTGAGATIGASAPSVGARDRVR